ncbi:MAG: hypothetical protein KAS59_00550 [Alphaproteobacteria bacterium]|nr:hypothetical protein [Alphaproteobacteria bacterium]
MNDNNVDIYGIKKNALIKAFRSAAENGLKEKGIFDLGFKVIPDIKKDLIKEMVGTFTDGLEKQISNGDELSSCSGSLIFYESVFGDGSVQKIVAEVRKDPANMTTPPKVKTGLFGNLMKRVRL